MGGGTGVAVASVGVGLVVGVSLLTHDAARRHRLDRKLIAVLFGTLLTGFAAFSIGILLKKLGIIDPDGRWLTEDVALWGLAAAYSGAVLTKRIVGYVGHTGDMFTPAVTSFMAITRAGQYVVDPDQVHFLIECVFHATAFVALWSLRDRIHVDGELLRLYILAYAAFRFFLEFASQQEPVIAGLTGTQLVMLPSAILLTLYFRRQMQSGVYSERVN